MAQKPNPKRVRLVLGLMIATFLIVNAILNVVAIVAGMNEQDPAIGLPPDISPAVRLLVFLMSIGLTWLIGRSLYRFQINGEISVTESTNTARVMVFCFLLLFATLSFLRVWSWFWLPVFFAILLVFSVITLWRLLGGAYTAGTVVCALAAAFVTFYLVS